MALPRLEVAAEAAGFSSLGIIHGLLKPMSSAGNSGQVRNRDALLIDDHDHHSLPSCYEVSDAGETFHLQPPFLDSWRLTFRP